MKTVLIVDDDFAITEVVREILAIEGYATLTAGDGREALAQLDGARPDLVLLDLMMPVLDGWQMLEAMRAEPARRGVPVVVMSAVAPREAAPPCIAVLQKPFPLDSLVEIVRRVTGGPG